MLTDTHFGEKLIPFLHTWNVLKNATLDSEFIVKNSNVLQKNQSVFLKSENSEFLITTRDRTLLSQSTRDECFADDYCNEFFAGSAILYYQLNNTSSWKMKFDEVGLRIKPSKFELVYDSKCNCNFRRCIYIGDPNANELSMSSFVNTRTISFIGCLFATSCGDMDIICNGKHYEVYGFSINEIDYLAIDSSECENVDEYEKACESIVLMFGLVGGIYYRGKRLIFSYSDAKYSDVATVQYRLGEQNARPGFGIFPTKRIQIHLGLGFHNTLIGSAVEFSKIVQKIYDSSEYARCIRIMIENPKIDWESRAILNTVALEGACNIVHKQFDSGGGSLRKQVLKAIRDRFEDVLSAMKHQLSKNEYNHVQRKLDGLNSPLNSDKLLASFEVLLLNLSDEEKEYIKKRNLLLHGKPILPGGGTRAEQMNIAYVLYFCSAIVLLKHVGYSGIVIKFANYLKLIQNKPCNDYIITKI